MHLRGKMSGMHGNPPACATLYALPNKLSVQRRSRQRPRGCGQPPSCRFEHHATGGWPLALPPVLASNCSSPHVLCCQPANAGWQHAYQSQGLLACSMCSWPPRMKMRNPWGERVLIASAASRSRAWLLPPCPRKACLGHHIPSMPWFWTEGTCTSLCPCHLLWWLLWSIQMATPLGGVTGNEPPSIWFCRRTAVSNGSWMPRPVQPWHWHHWLNAWVWPCGECTLHTWRAACVPWLPACARRSQSIPEMMNRKPLKTIRNCLCSTWIWYPKNGKGYFSPIGFFLS